MWNRLILYYPVSSLVTLFANILQNPNDARARSDVKLMNVVVNFLSTLVSDESNGSVKRMLALCGEFERIAQVVLDKAERFLHLDYTSPRSLGNCLSWSWSRPRNLSLSSRQAARSPSTWVAN